MKRILLSLIIVTVAFFITACNGRKSAVDFNNKLIEAQNSITDAYDQFVQQELLLDSVSFSILYDSLTTDIHENINELRKLKEPEEGQYFKETAIILFEKYEQMIQAKMEISSLPENDSIHIFNELIEEFNVLRTQADSLESILTKAQKEFAKTNKLVIKSVEIQ